MVVSSVKKFVNNSCSPAYVYFMFSVLSIILMMLQNLGNVTKYCVGNFVCSVFSTALVFVFKVSYVLFWTWILNKICKSGYKNVAWFLVLLPFLGMFIFIGLLFLSKGPYVEYDNKEQFHPY